MVRQHTVLVVEPALREKMEAIVGLLSDHAIVQACEMGDGAVRVILKSDVEDYTELPKLLIQNDVNLKSFREEELDLESAFMALTKGTSTRM